jgi:hypothetical protein
VYNESAKMEDMKSSIFAKDVLSKICDAYNEADDDEDFGAKVSRILRENFIIKDINSEMPIYDKKKK